jgi:hypothetical protein
MGESTIISHLIVLHQENKKIDFSVLIDDDTTKKVKHTYAELGKPEGLKTLYDALGGEIGYDQIKIGLVME